jgi:hypothetical protein
MNPTAAFGMGNALDPMTSCLAGKAFDILEFDCGKAIRGLCLVQSANRIEITHIGVAKLCCKQGGIIATFSGTYFNDHDILLRDQRKQIL